MKIKMILPALDESKSPFWRPIKYSLFPPIGLATLAGHIPEDNEIEIIDQHVEELEIYDNPDLVVIQVYITNAKRAYQIADHYRSRNIFVILWSTCNSLPHEAIEHADVIFLGLRR